VIGVVLLVAVTVVLAVVTGVFVFGGGDQNQQEPTRANFAFQYDSGAQTLEITFERGEVIASENLYVRGQVGPDDNTGRWNSVPGAGSASEVTPGATVTLGLGTGPVPDDYTVRVVYQSTGNETSTTLAQSTGPGA
jgi:FlaG/FlaF family flagellin (archaellin)